MDGRPASPASPARVVRERATFRALGPAHAKAVAEVDAILGAARVVLTRSGFDGLKVELVLAEAGLSTRCFYRHFATKEDLLLALYEEEVLALVDRLQQATAAAAGPVAAVHAWIEAMVDSGYHHRIRGRQHFTTLNFARLADLYPAEVAQLHQDVLAPLVAALEATDRPPGGLEPAQLALGISHLCRGILFDSALGAEHLSRDDAVALARHFADAVLR
jgi:AcrR family transcriptional regulator